MSKKTKKVKTVPLADFLASGPKLVTVRESTWAAIVDEDEAQKKPLVVDMSGLPTAPRSAVDIDYSTVPNHPPFVAHVANLSFEVDDDGLRRIFADLDPKSARISRDGARSRGNGLVEFDTRDNLIEALKRTDKEVYGRRIRINMSDKTDSHHTDSQRGNFGSRSYRSGEDRPEMADRWKKIDRPSDESSNDRSSMGFNRDRNNQGRSNFNSGPRDGQRSSDYGFGYPRDRDDRGGGGGRDHDRSGPRPRYNDDHNRQSDRTDRPRYSGRYNDTRDQNTSQDDTSEPPKERPRLQLQARTRPVQDLQPSSGSPSSANDTAANASRSITEDPPSVHDDHQRQESRDASDAGSSTEQSTVKPLPSSRGAGASIFGGAKPVDTTARQLEIERKLNELHMADSEATGEEHQHEGSSSSRPSYNRGNDRDDYRNKRLSYNDTYPHNRDRRDDGRSGHGTDYHHRREHSGGRRYEEDSRRPGDDRRRDRDWYKPPSRRDQDTDRNGERQHQDNYRPPNRDANEPTNHRRLSDDQSNSESQPRSQPQILRRPTPTEIESSKLQLSNKFDMLNSDDENPQSPSLDA